MSEKSVNKKDKANTAKREAGKSTPGKSGQKVKTTTSASKGGGTSGKRDDSKGAEISELKEKLAESQDRYLRLSAEFDNYRKRTLKEKMELTKSAGESLLNNLLPVMDDFDRALTVMESATDCGAMKEGIDLIYNKFRDFLKSNGLKEIEAVNLDFDTDLHEAITKIPAPEEKLKGKVVDVIQKGYYLNDKVIRYAKVVIGE